MEYLLTAMGIISKVNSFCDLPLIIIFSVILVLVTIVFCFWCIYILDAIRRKWKFYRNSSNRLLERDGDSQEEILAYNAKTEFVKYVFLFFINLLEWATVVSMGFNFLPNLILEYYIHSPISHGNFSQDHELQHSKHEHIEMKHFLSSLPFFYWGICCIILSLVLIASLFMYLAARQAKLSWIKSNKVPYLIVFFLISLIITPTISAINSTTFTLTYLYNTLLLTLALLFLVKQYRKLLMVINWSIIDLQISGNTYLLQKQIRMRSRFTRIFKLFFIGYIFVLPTVILGMAVKLGLLFFEQRKSTRIFEVYSDIYDVFYLVAIIVGLTGTMIMFIPYIGFGFSTMCRILWRLINGTTGYKTHFKYPLNHLK